MSPGTPDGGPFAPVERGRRRRAIDALLAEKAAPGGKTLAMTEALRGKLYDTDDALAAALAGAREGYAREAPDADLAPKLKDIDWTRDRILLYAGPLVCAAGVQDLLLAFPEIMKEHPRAKLLIVGEGSYREALEMLLWALSIGDKALLGRLLRLGPALEGGAPGPLPAVSSYIKRVGLEPLLAWGRETKPTQSVVFTGYLPHALYRHLLPCADLAVFPSVVAEASPLVLLEALSAGVLPVGSDHEGLGEGLRDIGRALGPRISPLLLLPIQPEERVRVLAANAKTLLSREDVWKEACRRLAEEYSCGSVAGRMAKVYEGLLNASRRASRPPASS